LALTDWDPVAANNATVLGVNIGEGTTAPSAVNNALRQVCADVAGGINLSLLSTFLSSTTLAQARTALGVTEGGASQTAFAALTNTANSVPYMTGSDAWALATLTSFGRTLIDDGDAATARTTLAALGLTSATFGANSLTLKFTLSNGDTLMIQGGTGSLAADTTGTVTFGTAYSVAPVCIVNGGSSNTGHHGDVHASAAATTTGVAICNSNGDAAVTYSWLAIGKA
jgi:hypothetical protein